MFIAASGTPFASTVIGDYASVYVDGATVTTFVGKVTTVTSNVNITVDVTTLKYGTAPSTSATARSCSINGAWATEQVLAAGGLASTTVAQSTKINFTGNLTLTASRSISITGTTTAPVWFSGYNTTPGDLDADMSNSLAKPVWTLNANFVLTANTAHQWWSGLSVVGNRAATVWNINSNSVKVIRCRSENTSTNASARAISAGAITAYSWFKCPTTATTVIDCVTVGGFLCGVVAEGGLSGFLLSTGTVFQSCVSLNSAGIGFSSTNILMQLFGCTVYNSATSGALWNTAPPTGCCVIGCLFNTCGAYGINNSSGTNTNQVFRACNDFYACSSGAENGFGDSPAFFGQTDGSAVVTSSTDMTPVVGSNARNNGFPGKFENQSYSNYLDIGAVDHVDPAAGGLLRHIGMNGGLNA